MFSKILIANRGEIACRVAATARRLGVRTVAVYSEADAGAAHVAACDEAVLIGPASPRESYLNAERVVAAALATGAQAVHPGYGFLSENEGFAQACADAGLVFIGPPASAIQAMGLKAESKRLMEAAGVPLVPGYHGADQDPAHLQREADNMGYPVLIKASAGGGGRGLRVVTQSEDFAAQLAACQREALGSFGDAAVLIERYVQQPRHIEIQVFADRQGQVVHLFERDCSVQRRHQKVLEEAPAPGMSEARRAEMGAAAVAAARAVGYVGAGTVEFIVEQDAQGAVRDFFFMEMNTRLQVEHPVTEAVTGLDLVEWQLRVAAGEPLPLRQDELRLTGHAIEARICAEQAEAGFLPAMGRLDVVRWPAHVRFERAPVRVDAGVREGDAISPHYDSMIAKLIVWGENRAQALARLDASLAATHLVGLHTNVAFLRRCVVTSSFREARLDTALIERERAALFDAPGLSLPLALAGLVAQLRAVQTAAETSDPWSRRDGWRLAGPATQFLRVAVGEGVHELQVQHSPSGALWLCVGGERHALQVQSQNHEQHQLSLAGRTVQLHTYAQGDKVHVFADAGSAVLRCLSSLAVVSHETQRGGLNAPMPGKLIALHVKPGDSVQAGQTVAVMEAMKMEHTLTAPRDGTVEALNYAVGDAVAEGAALLTLADSSA